MSITYTAGLWYVLDAYAPLNEAYVSGPWPDFVTAERDRHQRNIGADCDSVKAGEHFPVEVKA